MSGFFLPLNYEYPQNLGYMWNMKEIEINKEKWTSYLEPQFVVDDISNSFKENEGLINKRNPQENSSLFLVRFKKMWLNDYIENRVLKWKEDKLPDNCKED